VSAGQPPIEEFELQMPDDLDVRHCFKHPDRETGVSCSNCGKAICHECMTPAPVGFRCPDCMSEQRHSAGRAKVITRQQTRSRWQGGSLLGAGGSPVTRVLIILNVIAFALDVLSAGPAHFTDMLWGNNSVDLGTLSAHGALIGYYVAMGHEYWRLGTSMFLHSGLLHILFNMYALYVFGSYLEQIAGSRKFLAIYLVSGLSGSVAAFTLTLMYVPIVGASGAIYGILGAFFMYTFHNRADLAASMMMRQLGILVMINLFISFRIPNISWQAHIGGLIGGVIMVELLTRFGRKSLRGAFDRDDVVAVLGFIAVLVALTWWHVQSIIA